MTKAEAVELATQYVVQHITYAKATAEYAVYLRANMRPELNAQTDAWIVHFPRILEDGVDIAEPDTVGILVDTATRSLKVAMLL